VIVTAVLAGLVSAAVTDRAVRSSAAFSRRLLLVATAFSMGVVTVGFVGHFELLRLVMIAGAALVVAVELWFRRLRTILRQRHEWPSAFRRSSQFGVAAYKRPLAEVVERPGLRHEPYPVEVMWRELATYVKAGVMVKDRERRNIASVDFSGELFNFRDGSRYTLGQPVHVTRRVICLGGSTMFCYEVADAWTLPVRIQVRLNELGRIVRVENYGLGGATLGDRARALRSIELARGDVVFVLFGVNEVGVNTPQRVRLRGQLGHLPLAARAVYALADVSAAMDWYSQRALVWEYSDKTFDHDVVNNLNHQLEDITSLIRDRGAGLVVALQPNLYTKSVWSADEGDLASRYPPHWQAVVRDGYAALRAAPLVTSGAVCDLSAAFDKLPTSPYLDWAHVNSRGNDRLAELITPVIANALKVAEQ